MLNAYYKESISKNNLLILTIKYGQAPVDVTKIDPEDYRYFKKVLIDRRNYKEAKDLPEQAINIFKFSKLGRINSMSLWNFVGLYPKFAKLVDWEKMPSYHVANLIIDDKDLISYVNFDLLDRIDIVRLLVFRPEYINLINLQKLRVNDWVQLLRSKPELAVYCDCDIFNIEDWVMLLSVKHELIDKCKYIDNFNGYQIAYILRGQPVLADQFNLWKIDDKTWADLVRSRPVLAGVRAKQSINGPVAKQSH